MKSYGLVAAIAGAASISALGVAAATSAGAPAATVCNRANVETIARAAVRAAKNGSPIPGVTLAVFYPTRWGKPVTIADGYADYATKRLIAPDARLLAGSIGKTFFGAAALKLSEEGKLDLDAPIARYLPDAGIPNAGRVTIRMLLSHTSGYGEYDGPFIESLIDQPARVRVMADWIGPLLRNPPSPPGTFRYSDINFVLLAEIIAKAAGRPWADYIDDAFLRPFGLTGTRAALSRRVPGLTPGYAGPKNFFGRDAMLEKGALYYNPQFESGGGGYVSTAPDLARWIVRLAAANAYSPAMWRQASTPTHPKDAKGDSYGLGIHIDSSPLGTAYGHSGYIPGYVSWVRFYERPGIAIAMQTNTSDDARIPWDGYKVMDELAKTIVATCHG